MTDDLRTDLALDDELDALRPRPGGTGRHPTVRKGIVTDTKGGIEVEVDGRTAWNVTGWLLDVDDVVWLLVDQGRRLVFGVTDIREPAP